MLVSFQRLSEGFESYADVDGQILPVDVRQCQRWLEDLPRANPKQTGQLLFAALAKNLSKRLEGSARYSQLEPIRVVVMDTLVWLERQYLGSPLPLTHDRAENAKIAEQLQLTLAHNYRLAGYELCYPKGSAPLLKGSTVNAALLRSMWHYQHVLYQTWKLYGTPAPSLWQSMHRVYRFAQYLKIESKSINEPWSDRALQISALYIEANLMALMNPLAFTQSEQEQLLLVASGFTAQCHIQTQSTALSAAKLPLDADLPAGVDLPEDQINYLSYAVLSTELEQASHHSVQNIVEIELLPAARVQLPMHFVQRVIRALGLASARHYARDFSSFPIETVIGLSSLHYVLAGKLDFDQFLQKLSDMNQQGISLAADWVSSGVDASGMATQVAQVLDHSLGGYRLIWPSAQSIRVRVGEVIGLSYMQSQSAPDCMVAIVRWLRYELDGQLMAGVELLSRRSFAVALRIQSSAGRIGSMLRGLELQSLDDTLPRQFLFAGRAEAHLQELDVVHGFEANYWGQDRHLECVQTELLVSASNLEYSVLVEKL